MVPRPVATRTVEGSFCEGGAATERPDRRSAILSGESAADDIPGWPAGSRIPALREAPAHAPKRHCPRRPATAPAPDPAVPAGPAREHAAPLSAIVRHSAAVGVDPLHPGDSSVMIEAELDIICPVPDYSVGGAVLVNCPVRRCTLARQIEHAVRANDRRVVV